MSDLVPVTWKTGLDDLRDRTMRLFGQWLPSRGLRRDDASSAFLPSFWTGLGGPAVDIEDRENEVVVTAELPGLDSKDFSVEVEADRLILRGEKKAETEKHEKTYYYRESSYGSFHRVVPLPAEVNRDNAKAQYKNGVLTVTLPKTEEAKARRITVNVN